MTAFSLPTRVRRLLVAGCLLLAACTAHDGTSEFNDPYEARNREVHEFNRSIDRALIKRASGSYGIVPEPVRKGVTNFAQNLDLPGDVVNSLLQGRIEPAVANTFRFLINSTLGVAGLFDPATSIGLPEKGTDFGETLHVWGVQQGAYLEVPLVGPTSERELAGTVVDLVLNPVRLAVQPEDMKYVLGAKVLSRFGDRYRYSDLIDSTLYESADSYAQARLLYLQNRAFQLGAEVEEEAYDPYEDLYGN